MMIRRTWSFTFHQQIPQKMWKPGVMHTWLCTERVTSIETNRGVELISQGSGVALGSNDRTVASLNPQSWLPDMMNGYRCQGVWDLGSFNQSIRTTGNTSHFKQDLSCVSRPQMCEKRLRREACACECVSTAELRGLMSAESRSTSLNK